MATNIGNIEKMFAVLCAETSEILIRKEGMGMRIRVTDCLGERREVFVALTGMYDDTSRVFGCMVLRVLLKCSNSEAALNALLGWDSGAPADETSGATADGNPVARQERGAGWQCE